MTGKYRTYRSKNAVKKSTAANPWLRQIFDEQDRMMVSTAYLSRLSGVSVRAINKMRHPAEQGKNPSFNQVRSLAEALDFRFPDKLQKNGD